MLMSEQKAATARRLLAIPHPLTLRRTVRIEQINFSVVPL